MRAILATLVIALACTSVAAKDSTPPVMTAAEAAATTQAAQRGTLMYAYDQAAWHGTDDLRTKTDIAKLGTGGWIVDGPAQAPQLVFFDKDAVAPHALYVADFQNGKLVDSHLTVPGTDTMLSPERKRMIGALRIARDAIAQRGVKPCSAQPFNTIVLPPAAPGGPIPVYFLTPQPTMASLPFGGHYLIEVAADGTAGPTRAFAKSCLVMPIPDKKSAGAGPVALTISHLLDPTPTEVHVFLSFSAHLPLIVVTVSNKDVWTVIGSRIALVSALKK